MLVAAQWTLLLAVAAGSIYGLSQTRFALLSTYLLLWSIFHSGEYTVTRFYLPRTLTPHSFLIYGARGSLHLAGVHLASIAEHVLTGRYWTSHGSAALGAVITIMGIVLRLLAIATCGNSFAHYIETQSQVVLVTHGVYGWCRHPSYLGFLLYVIGMQVVLGNVVTFVLSMTILFRFFTKRMQVEEWFLVNRLYGQAYLDYQSRVKQLIPGLY